MWRVTEQNRAHLVSSVHRCAHTICKQLKIYIPEPFKIPSVSRSPEFLWFTPGWLASGAALFLASLRGLCVLRPYTNICSSESKQRVTRADLELVPFLLNNLDELAKVCFGSQMRWHMPVSLDSREGGRGRRNARVGLPALHSEFKASLGNSQSLALTRSWHSTCSAYIQDPGFVPNPAGFCVA